MAKKKATRTTIASEEAPTSSGKRPIESYTHGDKQRVNNPPVELVTPITDPPEPPRQRYAFDPHLDPALQFDSQGSEVERVLNEGLADTRVDVSASDAVRTNGHHAASSEASSISGSLSPASGEREKKEGLAGKVQMIYLDPPLEQRQVEQAWDGARTLSPKPEVLLFAAFQFDPEAAKTPACGKPRFTASITTTQRPARSNQATPSGSPCGCWTPTTTAAACSRAKSSSRCPATKTAGHDWPKT